MVRGIVTGLILGSALAVATLVAISVTNSTMGPGLETGAEGTDTSGTPRATQTPARVPEAPADTAPEAEIARERPVAPPRDAPAPVDAAAPDQPAMPEVVAPAPRPAPVPSDNPDAPAMAAGPSAEPAPEIGAATQSAPAPAPDTSAPGQPGVTAPPSPESAGINVAGEAPVAAGDGAVRVDAPTGEAGDATLPQAVTQTAAAPVAMPAPATAPTQQQAPEAQSAPGDTLAEGPVLAPAPETPATPELASESGSRDAPAVATETATVPEAGTGQDTEVAMVSPEVGDAVTQPQTPGPSESPEVAVVSDAPAAPQVPDAPEVSTAPAAPSVASEPEVEPEPAPDVPETVEAPEPEPEPEVTRVEPEVPEVSAPPAAPEAVVVAPRETDENASSVTAAPRVGQGASDLSRLAPDVRIGRLPSVTGGGDTGDEAGAGTTAGGTTKRPVEVYAQPVDAPDGAPRLAIVLIDDGSGGFGSEALSAFPYPLSFAVNASAPNATERAANYRARGFEVLAMGGMPANATPQDVEVALAAYLQAVPEAVGVLDTPEAGLQGSRAVSTQVARVLAETGHGLVLFPKGLNTAAALADKQGVPSTTVFRDLDGDGQNPAQIRRQLDQAALRAGQDGHVLLTARLRPDTISALLLWGLQDRTGQLALVPASGVLSGN